MLFSIVTPSLNQGDYLKDCLESVRCQPGAGVEVEHIVIDGGSSDSTLDILRASKDALWVSEPDKGQTDAINKGFRKAKGDFLMWLNADDYLLPGALVRVLQHSQEFPEADVIYGDCLFVEERGRTIREKKEGGFSYLKLLLYGCYIPSTATFFKRNLIDRGLLLDAAYRVCMDYEYFMRLALAGAKFSHVDAILSAFRWHGSNASIRWAVQRRKERLQVQTSALEAQGMGWLATPLFLQPAFHCYRAARLLRKNWRRFFPR